MQIRITGPLLQWTESCPACPKSGHLGPIGLVRFELAQPLVDRVGRVVVFEAALPAPGMKEGFGSPVLSLVRRKNGTCL